MANPYKPEEAVMLIVWRTGGAALHSILADTWRAIGSQSELDYITANLTQRKIPWDNTNAANDDMSGFGTELVSPNELVKRIVAALGFESKVNGVHLSLADGLGFMNKDLHDLTTGEAPVTVKQV